ncbi:DUF3500 domain-containing protein [Hymenobacter jeollabukensis]|uniref:DUF3500 domain-containing protein n=1 Tax=Hymenobacter jeollabukensis TaxID=2025313 RepID=A0A5R8WT62_9BACT|nr:DUF3500 domain-containing protein [Hymenobacter jeollabukensis]TLM94028.1 DUF3500 domain-containing protein [Hymenobacter jeollabukensis]
MNKLVLVAPLLLAASAYEQVVDFFSPLAPVAALAAPAAATSAKGVAGVRSVSSTASVADVVTAANAFMATLSSSQLATLQQTFNSTNVQKWSNLPVSPGSRLGLQLSTLTAAQQAAALAVVQAATGTVSGDGFNEVQQIRAADDNLTANGGGSAYGSGVYLIAFLGTPSTTSTWMLQFGGHHLATNITFSNGYATGPTPKFEATEPLTFTTANANVFATGTVCAPLSNEAAAMLAMLNGLTAAQKSTAFLSQTFNDIVLGPGQDGNFPVTRVGLPVSQLSAAQQELVMNAMAPWVQDADDATAASLLAYYRTQLANTYIAYAGTGNLTTSGDYVRIDGPNVWIEFACQGGVVYRNQIHYHTIWRDRARDYGGNFYTTVTGTQVAKSAELFSVYPNPAPGGRALQVQLAQSATAATYTLRNTLGQTLASKSFRGDAVQVPTDGLAPGTYVLSLVADGKAPATHRFIVK